MSAKNVEFPETFFFKTRENGQGILQIVGLTDNQKGLKLRYRLIESPEVREAIHVIGGEGILEITRSNSVTRQVTLSYRILKANKHPETPRAELRG